MTCNVLAHIFQTKHFLDLSIHIQSCREFHFLFKMSFGWIISHKVWESYAWSKLSWLSLENPNLATFDFWWILSFLDELWPTINQMINVTSKCWCCLKILKFDCMLTKIDFLPNIVNFQSSEQLSEQTCAARLETWHEDSLKYMRNHETYLRNYKSKFLWENPNPNYRSLLRRRAHLIDSWVVLNTWAPWINLSLKNGRENFGVKQIPLFNLLKHEELDWHDLNLWLKGRRWLNT